MSCMRACVRKLGKLLSVPPSSNGRKFRRARKGVYQSPGVIPARASSLSFKSRQQLERRLESLHQA